MTKLIYMIACTIQSRFVEVSLSSSSQMEGMTWFWRGENGVYTENRDVVRKSLTSWPRLLPWLRPGPRDGLCGPGSGHTLVVQRNWQPQLREGRWCKCNAFDKSIPLTYEESTVEGDIIGDEGCQPEGHAKLRIVSTHHTPHLSSTCATNR